MAHFKTVNKYEPSVVADSDYWKSILNLPKYYFPETPNVPTGKAAHAAVENIDTNVYKPNAKMVSFRVTDHARLLSWLKCLAYRYHYQFGKKKGFQCDWINRLKENSNELIDEITLRLLTVDTKEENEKIITVNVYFSTNLITVQGNHYTQWVEQEVSYLKSVVEVMNNANPNIKHTSLLDVTSEYNDFESTLHLSETFSTPRITTPKTAVVPHEIQKLETSVCSRFVTLEEKLSKTNELLEEKINTLEERLSQMSQDYARKHESAMKANKTLEERNASQTNHLQKVEKEMCSVKQKLEEAEKEIISLKDNLHRMEHKDSTEGNNTKCVQSERLRNNVKKADVGNLKSPELSQVPTINTCTSEEDDTKLKFTIPTKNRFELLDKDISPVNKSTTNQSLDHTRENSDRATHNPVKKDLPIEIIIDSHGNGLDPKWIYKHKQLKLTILGPGKKNIRGAIEHLRKVTEPKHLILGVGSNDIANRNPEETLNEIAELFQSAPEDCVVHFLPLFQRFGDANYNKKVQKVNRDLMTVCTSTNNQVYFIEEDKISQHQGNYVKDCIHLSNLGRKNLVCAIKSHLNPHLGMKPYHQYQKPNHQKPRDHQYQNATLQHHPYPKFQGPNYSAKPQVRDLLEQLLRLV